MPETTIPDPERGESLITCTLSTSHKRHSQPQSSIQCTFAYQYLDGSSSLVDIELIKTPDGGLVFSNAAPYLSRALSERWHYKILTKLSTKIIVGTSEVQQVDTPCTTLLCITD